MKVKELINQLQKWHKPDDSLIVAYWSNNEMSHIPEKDWHGFADHVNRRHDFSHEGDAISAWLWEDYERDQVKKA
tara:strand:+ start:438 stop:662 length:225 start_codon:yes stop_codon:yes gene_type:complete